MQLDRLNITARELLCREAVEKQSHVGHVVHVVAEVDVRRPHGVVREKVGVLKLFMEALQFFGDGRLGGEGVVLRKARVAKADDLLLRS